MQDSQEILFTGGIDSDTDERFVSEGDYRSLINARMMTASNSNPNYALGGVQTVTGNTLYANPDLAVNGCVIGSCTWVEENAIIYFVYSPLGNHQIWKWSMDDQTFEIVFEGSILNFQKNYKVYHISIIDGLIYWTDGWFQSYLYSGGLLQFNPPRMADINKLIGYMQGTGNGGYTVVDFQTLDALKWPPATPTVQYATDTTVATNFLYGFRFKFRVRFRYDNFELSAWSAISKRPIPTQSDWISGRNWYDPTADNVIEVTIPTGHEIVTGIEVAVSINDGEFGIFKTLDKQELGIPNNSTYLVEYMNDSIARPIPLDVRNYDRLPQIAYCQEILPTKEISYTNFVEGYDGPDLDVALTHVLTELEGFKGGYPTIIFTNNGVNSTAFHVAVSGAFWVEGDIIQCPGTNYNLSYTVTAADIIAITGLTDQQANDYMMQQVGAAYVAYLITQGEAAVGAWNGGTHIFTITGLTITTSSEWYSKTARPTDPQLSVQTGSRQEIGIVYYDRGNRDSTVLTDPDFIIDIPFSTVEDRAAFTDPNNPYTVKLQAALSHLPPSWATHYQIVIRERKPNFQWRSVFQIEDTGLGRLKLSFEEQYLNTYGIITDEGATGGAKIYHRIQQGDVIRLIRKKVADPFPSGMPDYCTEVTELEVLAYSTNEGYNQSECVWVDMFDYNAKLGADSDKGGFLVQVETPVKASEVKIWREIGEVYQILNPHTATAYHAGNIQNQNAIIPAVVELNYGDVWVRPRYMGTGTDYGADYGTFIWPVEDPMYSDYYISNFNDYGRVVFEIVGDNFTVDGDSKIGGRTWKKASSIHSEAYLTDTTTNGLSAFNFRLTNVINLDDQWGPINRSIMSGYTLKLLQDRKETSVYIQRVPYVNKDSVREFTDKTFGGINPYDSYYGCIDPGSVVVVDDGIIYYDYLSSKPIWSRVNGQVDLADPIKYKTSVMFNSFRDTIESLGRAETFVLAAYDKANEEYVLQAIVIDDTQSMPDSGSENICFNIVRDRWTNTIEGRLFNWIHGYGDILVTWDTDARLYLENVGNEQEYYGQDIVSTAIGVINKYGTTTKRALSVGIKSLYTPTNAGLISRPTSQFPNGQETNMTNFQAVEEYFWTQVKRDIWSPNFATVTLALINGREMRSSAWALSCILPHSDDKNFIFSMKLTFTVSEPGK
jgi:hypothetical protein